MAGDLSEQDFIFPDDCHIRIKFCEWLHKKSVEELIFSARPGEGALLCSPFQGNLKYLCKTHSSDSNQYQHIVRMPCGIWLPALKCKEAFLNIYFDYEAHVA
jgi:hypothetical protein